MVISQYFGGGRTEQMQPAIHSSLALTAILSVLFTALGLSFTKPLLHAIGVPEDVMPNSALYLSIYFWGMTFSLFYNMGSGILRAIGDSKNPLFYLIAASLVNIVLDFLFVCGFGMGVEGAAIATIIAQAVSAALVMGKLLMTREIYRVRLGEICFDRKMIRRIVDIGLPAAIQQSITSFSNVIVQSYINYFGTAAMAGYSATLRVDGFLQLPLQSFNMTITTFVGQNIGAKEYKRVKKGIFTSWLMCSGIILVGSVIMFLKAPSIIGIFTEDAAVISVGSSMIRIFGSAYLFLPIIQILNGALRGAGQLQGSHVFHVRLFCASASDLSDDRRSYDKKCFRCFCRMACDLGGLRHRNAGLLF